MGHLPLGALLHHPFRHRLVIVILGILGAHTPEFALFFGIFKTELIAQSQSFLYFPCQRSHGIERLINTFLIVLF